MKEIKNPERTVKTVLFRIFLRQDHCIYLRSDFVENIAPVKMQNIYDALKRLRNRDIEINNEKMW